MGRDTSRLDPGEICRAVVESVAENTSDAVVAPLVWGAVAGVPAQVLREHAERAGGYALPGKKGGAGGGSRSNEKNPRRLLGILSRKLYLPGTNGRCAGVCFHG